MDELKGFKYFFQNECQLYIRWQEKNDFYYQQEE